ncbi:MAG TPA: DUF3014 domain-containing protein [Myxococcales bacterium]|nr:DUF3014 domain-containing protein [Myxococcales bacterium]
MGEERYPGARREAAQRRSNVALVIAVVILIAGGVAGVVYWRSRPAPLAPPVATTAPVAPPPQDAGIDAGEPPSPPRGVDAGTELHRAAGELSRRPEWAAWLAEPHLISRLVAAAHRVADGESPRPVLLFLAPDRGFTAVSRGGELFPAPESTARYDLVTGIVTAIEPARAAEAYLRLDPFFEAAYREVARPGERFAPVLHQAIHELLATPVPAEEPALVKNGTAFFYADEQLQKLHPAQKQLLRMGVVNARAIQRWLAAFDRALPR